MRSAWSSLERLEARTTALAVFIAAAVLALAVAWTGAGTSAERALAALSAGIRSTPASGRLHIVEIDARSIAAIDRWPWSRAEHARLIDRLSAAGAATIAFDVDFSSRSNPQGDAALAAAIQRANGKVILPTLRQAASGSDHRTIDLLPAPALREHAALAAVSVRPDDDGNVRTAPMGTWTSGTPRPSLSAILAGRPGVADASFPIDFGIDPATIPRHSFIDIRDGRFDPNALRGQQFVIGATAVEMGDRYAVPTHGVIPGVVIQTLAAETLMRGVPAAVGWPAGFALGCLLSWVVLRSRRRTSLVAAAIATPLALFGVTVGVQSATGAVMSIIPGLVLLSATIAGALGTRVLRAWADGRLLDPVTGLPNRQALITSLKEAEELMVLAARIPDFEKLAAGLSAEATGRLILRLVDRIRLVNGEAVVARINDRTLAWTAAVDHEAAGQQGDTLRRLMLSPIEVDGRRIDLRLAIGMAIGHAGNAEATVANAALASEQAQGKQGGWHLHTEAEGEAVDRELTLLAELNDAVLNGELEVAYQPKLDIATRRIASVEALVRWHHPTRGYMRPDHFVPLAERNDRIAGMTLFVVERTIRDLAQWAATGSPITGAINLSAKLLTSASFIADLTAILDRTSVPPEWLTFEVTESAAMSDPDEARAALMRFRDMGIAISMDDYGTGQSTLSYLKQLPLNELKIDRSFVQFAHQNRGDAILVRSTIDLAHELGLKVVAEGVEDEACLAFLASVGCDLAQGYLISRPVGPTDIAAMLGERVVAAA